MNTRLVRVAIFVSHTNATLGMQLRRLVREAGNDSRRVFTDAGEGALFLGEILDVDELRALAAFLAK